MKGYKGGWKMRDNLELIGKGSLIQHGKHNNRVYLMKLKDSDVEDVLEIIQKMAIENSYSKIFCKVSRNVAPLFFAGGYILEGVIPKFYNKKEDVFFMSKFLDSDRLMGLEKEQLMLFHKLLEEKPNKKKIQKKTASVYKIRKMEKSDVEQITKVYQEVFITYPFPIHNPGYILKTMEGNVHYFGAEKRGKIVAVASTEVDPEGKNAEMTDFATSFSHTGNNLSNLLMDAMEVEMKKQGITTLYTIARLNSIPMNKTFLRYNYEYAGTAIKNTNISGNIESMNIYYKHI